MLGAPLTILCLFIQVTLPVVGGTALTPLDRGYNDAQCHAAPKWRTWDSDPGVLTSEHKLLMTTLSFTCTSPVFPS